MLGSDITKSVITNIGYQTQAFKINSDIVLLRPGTGKVVNVFRLSDEQLINVGTINTTATDWVIHDYAVVGTDGKAYLAPVRSNRFYRINLSSYTLEEIGAPRGSEGGLNFLKLHVYGDYILYIPLDYNRLVRYHIPTDTMDDYGDSISGYGQVSTLYGDALWLSPYYFYNRDFKKFDLTTGVASNLGSPLSFNGLTSWNWAVGSDSCLYTMRHGDLNGGINDKYIKVDPIAETWSYVGTGFGNVSGYPIAGLKAVGDYIYTFVRDLNTGFIRFDVSAQDWETVPGSFAVSKFWSSVYDGGNYVSGRTRTPSGYQVLYGFSSGVPKEQVVDLGSDYDVDFFGNVYSRFAFGNSTGITDYPLFKYTEKLKAGLSMLMGANF